MRTSTDLAPRHFRRGSAHGWGVALLVALLAGPALGEEGDETTPVEREIERQKERGPAPPHGAPRETTAPPATPPTTPAPPRTPAKAEQKEEEGGGNVVVPLVMYTPETHVGVGAFYVHFFRLTTGMHGRVSSLAAVALITTRRQAVFELHPDFYWGKDRFHVLGKLEYQRFPDSFWGVGNNTHDADEERYQRDRLRFRGGPSYELVPRLYVGLATDVMQYTARYSDPNGVFATHDFPGEAGGFTAGLGPTVSLDTRDNAVATREGTLLSGAFHWFGSPISRYDFRKFLFEARRFFVIVGEHILGLRFYAEVQGGEVPYYHLAMLGGDELLRGYYLGRWRDKNLAALETEYRFPLVWRFGGVAFAGAGEVARKTEDLGTVPIRWAIGGGLRFSLNSDERLNLRLDAGFGPDTYGFYFTAREAF